MDRNYIIFIVSALVKCVILVVAILIAIAYLTLVERKVMAGIQRRLGPNSVGHINIMVNYYFTAQLTAKRYIHIDNYGATRDKEIEFLYKNRTVAPLVNEFRMNEFSLHGV